jgi:ribosomal protein L37AE/L43A
MSKKPSKCPECGKRPAVKRLADGIFVTVCELYGCDYPYMYFGDTAEESVKRWNKGVRR